jgi:hypothetical protein
MRHCVIVILSDKQTRGNDGEGQLRITNSNAHQFAGYAFDNASLARAIRRAGSRQTITTASFEKNQIALKVLTHSKSVASRT